MLRLQPTLNIKSMSDFHHARVLAPAALACLRVWCGTGASRLFHTTPSIVCAAKPRRIIIMLAVAGTLVIIAAGLLRPNTPQSTSARSSSLQIGAVAPDFTLTTPAGKPISLSNFRGKPVMLNFWYVTCPGCLAETPGMQKFYVSQHARGKNFVIL